MQHSQIKALSILSVMNNLQYKFLLKSIWVCWVQVVSPVLTTPVWADITSSHGLKGWGVKKQWVSIYGLSFGCREMIKKQNYYGAAIKNESQGTASPQKICLKTLRTRVREVWESSFCPSLTDNLVLISSMQNPLV